MHTVQLLKDRTEASGQKNLEEQVEEGSFCALPFLALFVGVWVELAGDSGPSGKGNSAGS